MGSAGSQNKFWQRHIPKAVVLARVIGSGNGGAFVAHPSIPMPDSRLRVKTSFIFVRDNNVASGTSPNATLWLFEADTEDAGMRGDDTPLANIIPGITQAAPLVIPVTAPLQGYTREFVSAADYINGELTVSDNGIAGYWVLQTRYQPQSVAFTSEEWDLITSQCNPTSNRVTTT
jgi:hypothetical protein